MRGGPRSLLFVAFASCFSPCAIQAWAIPPSTVVKRSSKIQTHKFVPTKWRTASTEVSAVDPTSSSLLVAEESWRQYVPLVASVIVIVDILLGSPLLNLVVAPMKRQAEGEQDDNSNVAGFTSSTTKQQPRVNPKERIDSEKVAQEALDKARNSLELREYLERQKSDWDRMEEIRKKMDQDMAKLDETLAEKRKHLEE